MDRPLRPVSPLPLANPIGWDLNPSSSQARIPIFAAALCGAFSAYLLYRDFPDTDAWITRLWAFCFIGAALLSLCGGARRWSRAPHLVTLTILFAGLCVLHAVSAVVRMALLHEFSWLTLLTAVLALFCLGPSADEWLASLQHIRLQAQRGRAPLRTFFGLSERIRPRKHVSCDPLFGKE
jgi:hypothetical protein